MHWENRNARLAGLSAAALWSLVLITLAGAVLRVLYQVDRPFIGDEVGSLIHIQKDYRFLMTHFLEPWLTMPFYLVLLKWIASVSGNNSWAMVLPGIVAGVAVIPLVAAVGVRFAGRRAALIAAFLVALNPYLIHFSAMIRSYSLMMAFALGALIFLVDWFEAKRWRDGIGFAACAVAALLMSLNGLFFMVFLFLFFAAWAWTHVRDAGAVKGLASLVVPALAAAVLLATAYVPVLDTLKTYQTLWSTTPPTTVNYIPTLFSEYFATGYLVLPTVLLIGLGLWSAVRDEPRLLWLGSSALVMMLFMSRGGMSLFPWAAARYLQIILPILILFMAQGIVFALGKWPAPACWAAAVLIVASWGPSYVERNRVKTDYPWQEVASVLKKDLIPGDKILCVNTVHAELALRPYFMQEKRLFVKPAAYFGQKQEPAERNRLFVISPNVLLASSVPRKTIGKVQVLEYAGTNRTAIGKALLADLDAALDRTINPEQAGHYRLALDVMSALSIPDENAELTSLYYESLMRTRGQRFAPEQLFDKDQRGLRW